MKRFFSLRVGPLELRLIEAEDLAGLIGEVSGSSEAEYFAAELQRHYAPRLDIEGRRNRYGFATYEEGVLKGFSLLGISSFEDARGYTGADTLAEFRGQGIAPRSKPALFKLGFELLGPHRIESGCLASNLSSRRSIEKTPGFVFEGVLRGYAKTGPGVFEDERRYAIIREDW